MRNFWVFLLLVGVLAACASPAPQTEPTPRPAGEASATPTGAFDVFIRYEKTGGFAGLSERWTITREGQVISETGEEHSAGPEQVEALSAELEALGFFELDDSYTPSGACNDCFNYTITVSRGEQVKTVAFVDSGEAPDRLYEMIARIDAFLEESRELPES
jgi:hypothetical protein